MNPNLTAWAGACAIALLLGICWDQPSDLQAMRDVSSAREDAIKERRRDLAIARMCIAERGPNSSWIETADGGIPLHRQEGSCRSETNGCGGQMKTIAFDLALSILSVFALAGLIIFMTWGKT